MQLRKHPKSKDRILRHIKKVSQTRGLSPGTVLYIGEKRTEEILIDLIDYSETEFLEKRVETIEECLPFRDKSTVTWINITGIHNTTIIEKIGNSFGLHPLTLEDITNTVQRPKIEELEDHLFIIVKMTGYSEKEKEINIEQISIIIGPGFVLSFQEKEGDVFDTIRQRLRSGRGKIRKMGAGYLAYCLIDAIVDNYFLILEQIGEDIEELEERLLKNPEIEILNDIHKMKREMIFLRRSVWPLREVVGQLGRHESRLIDKSLEIYFRDLYDHTIQVIETLETFRDMVSGMLDVYLSSVSNKMNQVMKILTMFASIFIPLTLIAGIYGMNFKYMPELNWKWGYPLILCVIITIGVSMAIFFKKKKWF